MKERSQPLNECRTEGALIIDLPVHRHQDLDRLYLRTARIQPPSFLHEFVGEVLNRVTEKFERMTGIG